MRNVLAAIAVFLAASIFSGCDSDDGGGDGRNPVVKENTRRYVLAYNGEIAAYCACFWAQEGYPSMTACQNDYGPLFSGTAIECMATAASLVDYEIAETSTDCRADAMEGVVECMANLGCSASSDAFLDCETAGDNQAAACPGTCTGLSGAELTECIQASNDAQAEGATCPL